jgi:hypothetical protein
MNYILFQKAETKEFHNGVRDKGRDGWTLDDFMKSEQVQYRSATNDISV